MQFVHYLPLHRTLSNSFPIPPPAFPTSLYSPPTTSSLPTTYLFSPSQSFPVFRSSSPSLIHLPNHSTSLLDTSPLPTSSNSSLPRPISHLLLLILGQFFRLLPFFKKLKDLKMNF